MISIIIPLYNAEKYILQTIQSCLDQDYKNFEMIIIDDCSTDGSYELVLEESKKDDRIKVLKNQNNKGLITTINLALQKCNGEYVIVLGNDDTLKRNHLCVMNELIRSNKYSFVYCSSDYIDEYGSKIGESKTIDININKNRLLLARGNVINSCGLILNKKILLDVGGYPEKLGFKNYGEWYLWLEMISKAPALYTKAIKSNYRIHSQNLTKTFLNIENVKNNRDYNLICMRKGSKCLSHSFIEKIFLAMHRFLYKMKMTGSIYFRRKR